MVICRECRRKDRHILLTADYNHIKSVDFESKLLSRYSGCIKIAWISFELQLQYLSRFPVYVDHLERQQAKELSEFVTRRLEGVQESPQLEAAVEEFLESATQEGLLAAFFTRRETMSHDERTDFIANVVFEAGSRRVMRKYGLSEREMIEVIRKAFEGLR